MQKTSFSILVLLSIFAMQAQKMHNGLPAIQAKDVMADYRIGDDWYENKWIISPQIQSDTLAVPCFLSVEDVAFYTDKDSIQTYLSPEQSYNFYVQLDDSTYALTVIQGVIPSFSNLDFDSIAIPSIHLVYEQNNQNAYLNLLREKYKIDHLIKHTGSDTERALTIMHWVHEQWKHDEYNVADKKDALSILNEAKKGTNFRCVEYGIVTAACLNAIGLKARVLGLKIKDIETTVSGAGHVVTEAYLSDLKKWVMIDSQWDAMPVLNGIPLNAVEFQQAIADHYSQLEINSLSGISKRNYTSWIYPYLYYFNCPLDNREGTDIERQTIDGKKALMLVPVGAKNPTVFQINCKLDYCIYTHSLKEFYAPPAGY